MQRYDALLSPIRVGDIFLKNRMMSSASTPHFLQGRELWPTEKIIGHFANRARSGAAAITINHLHVDAMKMPGRTIDNPPAHFNMYELDDATCQNYMCQLIDAIHCYGSKVTGYIMGPVDKKLGPELPPMPIGGQFAPPPPPPDKPHNAEDDGPPAVDINKIDRAWMDAFIADYVMQAKDLKALGFDIVSIYACYRNQPMSRMFSPITNFRTDEYGGSLENRARFTIELLTALRKALGKGFPIELVFSVCEPEGGYTTDDCIEFAKLCDGLVDILHLRGGEMDPQHCLGFTSPEDVPEPYLEEMGKVTKGVHAAGLNMVVGVSSGMFDIQNADNAVRDGKADLVYMARSWVSNPNYGQLVYEGRGEDIVPCVRCNKCHVPSGREMFRTMCTVNPTLGMEDRLPHMYAESVPSRKVAVVGGGPAGMEFAKIAAERGHSVTLYEASDALGGLLRHADYATFKWPLRRFKDYLANQMDKLGVTVKLNTRATKEMLLAEGYDMVAVAVGAHPIAPPFPGKDLPNVFYGMHIYGEQDKLGDTVAVIGGGEIGVETALWLCEIGKECIVMEMLPELIADAPHAHYKNMVHNYWLREPRFHSLTGVRCTEICPDGVKYIDKDGVEKKVMADSVLLCAGAASNCDAAQEFIGSAPQMAFIGDVNKFGNVQKAVREGFAAAMNIR